MDTQPITSACMGDFWNSAWRFIAFATLLFGIELFLIATDGNDLLDLLNEHNSAWAETSACVWLGVVFVSLGIYAKDNVSGYLNAKKTTVKHRK